VILGWDVYSDGKEGELDGGEKRGPSRAVERARTVGDAR